MIEINGISKKYGTKQVLENVTFTAENGYVTGFVGPNGAGKSTTMRMVAAIENPDSGTSLIDGKPFSKAAAPAQTMGIYLGGDYLPQNMTGAAYMAYVCKTSDIPKSNIAPLLEMVQLTAAADRKISSYSLGMKQRIGLAVAIAGNAGNLMLDEPVNGLDPAGVQWLRGLIRAQADQGKAVLLSSHLLSELELVADKIVMLDQGRIISQGMIKDLEKGKTRKVAIHTSDDAKLARYLAKKGARVETAEDHLVVYGAAPNKMARVIVNNGLDLYLLEERHDSLEEMFMNATNVAGGAANVR